MTVEPTPAKKTPWLFIIPGIIIVLCLCVVVIGIAYVAFFVPVSTSRTVSEPTLEEATPEISVPTTIPAQGADNPLLAQAAPAGSAVDIGNDMTLTIRNVTRPADDIVANGSFMNTTAPEGEEFMQVEVQVTCAKEAGTQCRFFPTVLKVILNDGSTRDLQIFIEGVDDWDTAIDIAGGATEQGMLLFIVPTADTDLIIRYQDIYADQPLYMQLP